MTKREMILLVVPSVLNSLLSLIIIIYQTKLDAKIKKIEKAQLRKDDIIDEYIRILSDVGESIFFVLQKLRAYKEIKEDLNKMDENINICLSYCRNNYFLLNKHEKRIISVRSKCLDVSEMMSIDEPYLGCGREDIEKMSQELRASENIVQEIKKEAIEM